jgi:hypothetical protein
MLFVRFFGAEIRAWRGDLALYKVFWGYGVIGSAILAFFYGVALATQRAGLQQALLLCFAGYTVWILVSVWRCAENSQEEYWGLLARQLTVVWAGNAIMLLFFLEIDVLKRLLGA